MGMDENTFLGFSDLRAEAGVLLRLCEQHKKQNTKLPFNASKSRQVPPTTFCFLELSEEGSILVFIAFLRVPIITILLRFWASFLNVCFALSERVSRVPLNVSKSAKNDCLFCNFICLKCSNIGFNFTVMLIYVFCSKKFFYNI